MGRGHTTDGIHKEDGSTGSAKAPDLVVCNKMPGPDCDSDPANQPNDYVPRINEADHIG